MKKVLALAISFMIVLSLLSGCAKSTTNTPQGSSSSSTSDTVGQSSDNGEKAGDKTPIEFTLFDYYSGKDVNTADTPVGKKIQELTGVSIKIEHAVGDPKQKISVLLAGGDYPDLMFPAPETKMVISSGVALKLDDLIDKYAPNLKTFYGETNALNMARFSKEDPSIYFVPSGQDYPGNENWEPNFAFFLQNAVVKELGYPKMKTLSDYENAIKSYVDKYPSIDGKPTIGLSLIADDWRWIISVTNPAFFSCGNIPDDEFSVDPVTLKTTHHVRNANEKEYFRWLNHMNDIGLLDPETFVQKYDQYTAKIASGRVLGVIDAAWEINDGQTALKKAGKFDRAYGAYPCTLNEDTKNTLNFPVKFAPWGGMMITNNCKNPERAMEFINWVCTDEAQVLINWGIEGQNYNIVDGKRVIPQEEWDKRNTDADYGTKTGVGLLTFGWPQRCLGQKDATEQNYIPQTKESIKANYSDVEKEVLSHYGVDMWIDLWPARSEFKPVDHPVAGNVYNLFPGDSEESVIMQRCMDITKKRVAEAVMSKPDKFDAVWNTFMKELDDAGAQKLYAGFEKLLKDKMELWK